MIPGAVEVPREVLAELIRLAEPGRLAAVEALVSATQFRNAMEAIDGKGISKARERYADALEAANLANDTLCQATALLRPASLADALAHCKQAFAPLMEPLPAEAAEGLSGPSPSVLSSHGGGQS